MKILIAPDKFKDALTAPDVAAALATGVREARPDAEIVCCPLGDGGEGTGAILAQALGAEERTADVLDPLGRLRTARWWLHPDRRWGIVEMAEASGLALLQPGERNPLDTTSYGTGQLLRAAAEAGCMEILLCVGGSATVDGGAGCLQGLGHTFHAPGGRSIDCPITGGMLLDLHTWQPRRTRTDCRGRISILSDVDNLLCGPSGAAGVFGPQKGASPGAVAFLEAGLRRWARRLRAVTGVEVRHLRGGGAAGGITAGLAAVWRARRYPGFVTVGRLVGFSERMRDCELCLTGEGRIDEQTAHGKVVRGVAVAARGHGIPALALVGAATPGAGQTVAGLAQAVGVASIVEITPPGTALAEALASTAANLRRAARETVQAWARRGAG